MEEVGLAYSDRFQVLICKDHGYCLTNKGYRRHLWALHAVKGEVVQVVANEVDSLVLAEPTSIPSPPPTSTPIPGLIVYTFFRCTLPECDGGPTACSRREETVVKHQAKAHNTGSRKKTKRASFMIKTIYMQTFFPQPHHRWFEVVAPIPNAPPLATTSTASDQEQGQQQGLLPQATRDKRRKGIRAPQDASQRRSEDTGAIEDRRQFTKRLEYLSLTSQTAWSSQFEQLSSQELHASQTPPWLVATGIAAFLEGLPLEKSELFRLRSSASLNGRVRTSF